MVPPRSSRPSLSLLGMGSLALVAGAALIAWHSAVRPLKAREARIAQEYAALGERLAEGRRAIKEVQNLEQHSISVAAELAELHRDSPEGSPLLWLPLRVKEELQRFKCTAASTRMNSIRDVTDLPGYQRIGWKVEIPVKRTPPDIRNALSAILEIETVIPFVRVQDVAIGPDPADSSRYSAVAGIALLAPKR